MLIDEKKMHVTSHCRDADVDDQIDLCEDPWNPATVTVTGSGSGGRGQSSDFKSSV
jgi:hypothetical protein